MKKWINCPACDGWARNRLTDELCETCKGTGETEAVEASDPHAPVGGRPLNWAISAVILIVLGWLLVGCNTGTVVPVCPSVSLPWWAAPLACLVAVVGGLAGAVLSVKAWDAFKVIRERWHYWNWRRTDERRERQAYVTAVRNFACRACKAMPGEPCKNSDGSICVVTHGTRRSEVSP